METSLESNNENFKPTELTNLNEMTAQPKLTETTKSVEHTQNSFWNSYSINVIINWLNQKNPIPKFCYSKSNFAESIMRNTGMQLELNNKLRLSIQTDPNTAFHHFAETALLGPTRILYDESLGYSDVCHHDTPEELFEHIDRLFEQLKIKGDDYILKETHYDLDHSVDDNYLSKLESILQTLMPKQ